MEVRPATLMDVPALVEMGEKFYEEAGYRDLAEFDIKTSFEFGKNAVIHPNYGAFIALDEGEEVGFCIGAVYNYFFNAKVVTGQEIAWWCEPSKRGTKAGIGLFDALENWAEAQGATLFTMLCLENENRHKVERFYKKNGYVLREHSFVKKLK